MSLSLGVMVKLKYESNDIFQKGIGSFSFHEKSQGCMFIIYCADGEAKFWLELQR